MPKATAASPYKATRNYDGKSAEKRRGERRQQLIETCIQMVGREGYAAASLNGICAEAGLTKRYFYESFDGVESLLRQSFRQISNELQQQVIAQIGGQKTPEAMITAGFRAFFEYIRDNPERGRVFLVESLSVNATRNEFLGNGGGSVSPFLVATTLQFVDEEVLPQPVMSAMAQGAVGAAIFVGQNWIASEFKQPIEELVQAVSEICFGIGQRLHIDLSASLNNKR